MVKNYMLDTNVLMSDPNSIFGFEDNNVYLCGTILQELDKHKNDEGEHGYNAREAIRTITNLMDSTLSGVPKEDRLETIRKEGINLPNGGKLFFEPDGVDQDNLPKGYDIKIADNRIISSCIHMNKTYLKDNPITLLTEDNSCLVNALVCGVNAENVRNDQSDPSYSGHLEIEISKWELIDELYQKGEIKASSVKEFKKLRYPLLENQFVTITSGNKSVLSVHQKGMIKRIKDDFLVHRNIRPLNKMQAYAMWALLNPNIPLVILEGPAGTSKTFSSLACGLHQLGIGHYGDRADFEIYDKLLISRPNNKTSDQDFGYLPGTLEEKMSPLVASYMDNLETIYSDKKVPVSETREVIDNMLYNRYIELCPLYSIRGRSISNSFLICDESQNAAKKLIKDVVTRPCKNTKIVIAGDPTQIDNVMLDFRNNGLIYAKDTMKGSPLVAVVRFDETHCVRSELAEEALKRMK